MKKETYKIPKIDYVLDVYKNSEGFIQKTKIKKAGKIKAKAFNAQDLNLKKVDGLSDFQLKVYKALKRVPAGKVLTYKELATKLGQPNASRAIGTAMRRNPVPYIVPCHRVVRGDGKIGNFSAEGGSGTKAKLLASEGINLSQKGRIL